MSVTTPRNIVRSEGAKSLLFRLLGKLMYRRVLVLECDLGRQFTDTSTKTSVDIRRLGPADTSAFIDFRSGPDRSIFLARLKQGHACYAAICADRIVSVSWIALSNATLWLLDADFRLDLDQLYIYDSYTHPDHRGLRLQAQIFEDIRREFGAAGVRRAITFVVPENVANLKSRARLGFTKVGIVRRVRFGTQVRFLSSENAPVLTVHRK